MTTTRRMRVLVACEFSGIVRDAFIEAGHDAISCDLLPTERPGPHIQGDVRPLLKETWDLVIAHPPCTYLSNVRRPIIDLQDERFHSGVEFFKDCLAANAPRVAVENPVSHTGARQAIGKYSQLIRPWWFGEDSRKGVGLWLEGLPPLMATYIRPTS